MKCRAAIAMVLAFAAVGIRSFAEAPTVSEKKDVAVLALGYYGWNIPLEAIGSIDSEIQGVFSGLGRFNIIGLTQKLSATGLAEFIDAIKRDKARNFVMPDKFQFGEATFTEAEYNRILGAFIVAIPVVSTFSSTYDSTTSRWVANIKTDVTFLDVSAGGSTIGMARVSTSGSDKASQLTAVTDAISAIPSQLEFEIRSIEAFQISTRILAVSGGEVRIQLGSNMGLKKGDEYSVTRTDLLEGFKDEREVGLLLIKSVGAEISTAVILYGGRAIVKDAQLREIPRFGADLEPFFRYISGQGVTVLPGLRVVESRGFFGFKPYVAVELPLGLTEGPLGTVLPLNFILGGQYDLHLARLTLSPYVGAGASWLYLSNGTLTDTSQKNLFPHVGIQAYAQVSVLVTKDLRVFASAGAEYWLSTTQYFDSYWGLGFDAGVAWKL